MTKDKEFVGKKNLEFNMNFTVKDKKLFDELTKRTDPTIDMSFKTPSGKVREFKNCSYILSKDGKSMHWFNDNHEGIIEVK